jgi:hypothetical protein
VTSYRYQLLKLNEINDQSNKTALQHPKKVSYIPSTSAGGELPGYSPRSGFTHQFLAQLLQIQDFAMPRHGLPLLLLALVALCFNALFANAQFGNMFQNMFGQEQTHQQQHFQNHHGANVRGWQIQDEGEPMPDSGRWANVGS